MSRLRAAASVAVIERSLPRPAPPADPARVELSASRPWPASWHAGASLVPAGVLVPVVDRAGGPQVLLTRRSSGLKHHAGQVSFPGGRMEESDADIHATALRETHEEIGVAPEDVRIVGSLSAMPTITGYAVTPVVGILQPGLRLTLDPVEVELAFEVPLEFFLDRRNETRTERIIEGVPVPLLEFRWGGERIWGATAAMLAEFRERLIKTIE